MAKVSREVWEEAESAIHKQMNIIDENRDGGFSKEEFLVYCKVNGVDGSAAINKLYEFDSDGDSGISKNEFIRGLYDSLNEEQIKALGKEGKEPDYVKKLTEKVKKAQEEVKAEEARKAEEKRKAQYPFGQ